MGVISSCSGVAEIVTVFPLLVSSSTMVGVGGVELAVDVATGSAATTGSDVVAVDVATGSEIIIGSGVVTTAEEPPPPTSGVDVALVSSVEVASVEGACTGSSAGVVDASAGSGDTASGSVEVAIVESSVDIASGVVVASATVGSMVGTATTGSASGAEVGGTSTGSVGFVTESDVVTSGVGVVESEVGMVCVSGAGVGSGVAAGA